MLVIIWQLSVLVWPTNIRIEVTYIRPMDLQVDHFQNLLQAKELVVKKNVDGLTKWQRKGHLSNALVAHPTQKGMKTLQERHGVYITVFTTGRSKQFGSMRMGI